MGEGWGKLGCFYRGGSGAFQREGGPVCYNVLKQFVNVNLKKRQGGTYLRGALERGGWVQDKMTLLGREGREGE